MCRSPNVAPEARRKQFVKDTIEVIEFEANQPLLQIRVGCALGYFVSQPTPIFLLVEPTPDSARIVLATNFSSSCGAPIQHLVDWHGNHLIRSTLLPGYNELRQESVLVVPDQPENHGLPTCVIPIEELGLDILRYTFPSRYCESDKLANFAWNVFGHLRPGRERIDAVCAWIEQHIEYRAGSGSMLISACDVLQRRYGVCRDFAHVTIALCRALDLPARYVAGHVPHVGDAAEDAVIDEDSDFGRDFHAYVEVYLGHHWHTFDARHNKPLRGRVKIGHGMDAVDAAFATFYGNVEQVKFEVWSHCIDPLVEQMPQPVYS